MSAPPVVHDEVVCPFCGLLCDDLRIAERGGVLKVDRNGCPKAVAGFERQRPVSEPLVDGEPSTLERAIARAAGLLSKARQPLVGGLGTDVAGMRAAVALAERTGGILDHMHGEAVARSLAVLQDRGWFMSTLTEVRNRADLIVLAGTDTAGDYPRFLERCVPGPQDLLGGKLESRRVVYLGRTAPKAAALPKGVSLEHLRCDPDRFAELFAALRAVLAGRTLDAKRVAGLARKPLQGLAEAFRAARYSVVAWAPEALAAPGGALITESICALVADLNADGRSAGLALGGNDGAATALNVSAWLTGYPLRVGFGAGHPEYHPARFAAGAALASREADLLLWISSFRPEPPPPTEVPTVVLGTPSPRFRTPPAVYIPVGTPGLDHPGQLLRCDGVVSLPLRPLRANGVPSVAAALTAILEAL